MTTDPTTPALTEQQTTNEIVTEIYQLMYEYVTKNYIPKVLDKA